MDKVWDVSSKTNRQLLHLRRDLIHLRKFNSFAMILSTVAQIIGDPNGMTSFSIFCKKFTIDNIVFKLNINIYKYK